MLRALSETLSQTIPEEWHALIFVRNVCDLAQHDRIEYIQPALPKNSWLARMYWEAFGLRRFQGATASDVFLSLQSSGCNVASDHKLVYCHNPLPFANFSWRTWLTYRRLWVLKLVYSFLYRFTITPEYTVIVQHDWMRDIFGERYSQRRTVVAWPDVLGENSLSKTREAIPRPFTMFYPTGAYFYKNVELVCEAAAILAKDYTDFELVITLDGSENTYASRLVKHYGKFHQIRFVGNLSTRAMDQQYRVSDLLLFPSLLETWGLPLSEAKAYGLPILAADLPYAHETIGIYDRAAFIDPYDATTLANRILGCWRGDWPLERVTWPKPASPFLEGWHALAREIFNP